MTGEETGGGTGTGTGTGEETGPTSENGTVASGQEGIRGDGTTVSMRGTAGDIAEGVDGCRRKVESGV